ncbi:zinc finger MYM-type protein 1-like [Apostichopus japonicus]|uniref:zinc finger MYM-type protein 1-like n=1 Tax=Stichopus japonicus TaxID=307972 RepID=UPI003AB8BF55
MPRAQRQKRMREKLLKVTATKIPKLTQFFNKVTKEQEPEPECETPQYSNIEVNEQDENTNSLQGSLMVQEITDTETAGKSAESEELNQEEHWTQDKDLDPHQQNPIQETGPAKVERAAELKEPKGLPCQSPCCTGERPFHPTVDNIKQTSVKQKTGKGSASKTRLCPQSIFRQYTWLSYCMTKGTISCHICKRALGYNLITASHGGEEAFFSGAFCNWKKCYEKLSKHACSHFHAEAVEKIACFEDKQQNIAIKLDSKQIQMQEMHRQLLLKQIESIQYLTRQGLSIRGKNDDESNLIQLLRCRANDVPGLAQWVEDRRYLSHEIINELIEMMGNSVLRSIISEIHTTSKGLYGIIADESRDISNKEQMTCVLRWISLEEDIAVHEDFVGMYEFTSTDAITITASLKDILLRCNLPLDNCRWQSYDGAANMSGSLSGVATRITAENPSALYLHCCNHSLDLALQGCVKSSTMIRDSLSFAQDVSAFIHASPKRMANYQNIASEYTADHVENLHMLCPTRWTVRTKSISAILHNYEGLYATLVSTGDNSSGDSASTAFGLASKMEKFSTFIGLHSALNIFSVSEQVASTMQKPSITAQTVVECVNALEKNLQRQRNSFQVYYQQTVSAAEQIEFVNPPELPRHRKVPRRLQLGNAEQHMFASPEDLYRVEHCGAIDVCISELGRRFQQTSYTVLVDIETALINSSNGHDFGFSEQTKSLYKNDVDFHCLQAELALLNGIIKQRLPLVKKVTSMDTVVSLLSDHNDIRLAFPNVLRLIHIYLLAPMSAASGERSFSVQRRIKTYLRSTIGEQRYNNMLMLHIHKARTDGLVIRDIAKEFTRRNPRRMKYFGKF